MLLQVKGNKSKKTRNFLATIFLAKNRKGISLVIGYILLITISIVMSIIVFQWLRTYVPTESPKCSDGTSVFIKNIQYDCTPGNEKLGITVKNNGRFSVNGYFIHASDNPNPEALATIDMSSKITDGGDVYGYTNSIIFAVTEENYLTPNEHNITKSSFDVTKYCPCDPGTKLTKIEIIPTRVQEVDNKKRLVSCTDAKIEEVLTCS